MSATSAPYGLIPTYHPSGIIRPKAYSGGILSGLATALFKYTPILMQTTGFLTVAGATGAFLGSFAGVEYTDATGRRQHSPGWISGTVATNIIAYVWQDPGIIYRMQANGSLAQSSRGDEANFANVGTGNATTLYSTAQVGALVGVGVQGQVQVIDKFESISNDFGDAFTDVLVKISQSQINAPYVAI